MFDLSEIENDPRIEALQMIRTDMRIHLLYLLPRHQDFVLDNAWLAARTRLETREISVLTSRFFQVGLWTVGQDGKVSVPNGRLGLSDTADDRLSVTEYMTMASQILTELTNTGPCWYEFTMLATTQNLKKEFLSKVYKAMNELIEASGKVPSTTVLAWTNVSLDVLKVMDEKADSQ